MDTYTLYRTISALNDDYLYCYAKNDYCSYWRLSLNYALTATLIWKPNHNDVYGSKNIIYQSSVPITRQSNPELFL